MRRFFGVAIGIFFLAVLLGFIFWGIIKLQNSKTNKLQQQPTDANTGDDSMANTENKSSVEVKPINFSFNVANQTIYTGQASVLRIKKVGDLVVEAKADVDLSKSLIAGIPEPVIQSPIQPAVMETDKKGNCVRIIRGNPGFTIDREQTLNILQRQIESNPGSPTFSISLPLKESPGIDSFDTLRMKLGFQAFVAGFETLHMDHMNDVDRNENIRIAAEKIDGLIIKPGEEFGFNKIVGNRSRKNGFRPAGVISNGKVIPGLGGGICQVSTTIYRTALLASVKIIERYNHSIYDGIPYADRGLDAAVSWGSKDFRFLNSLNVPILISCLGGQGRVHVSFFALGEKLPFEKVAVETRNERKHPFPVQVIRNAKLKPGDKKVVQPGVTGYTIEAYRIVTKEGVSREERLSQDNYLMYPRIEEVSN